MKRYFFYLINLLTVTLSTIVSIGQYYINEPFNDYKITPSAPTVASLNNFVELPFSYFTGNADINIPIHEVKTRDILLPISLYYWSSGVKVDDIATPQGINWNISAGGYISRAINGIDDFIYNSWPQGYCEPYLDITKADLFNNPPDPYNDIGYYYDYFDNALTGEHDFKPDVFSYHIPGYSGKFIFKQTNDVSFEVLKLKHDDVVIEYVIPTGSIPIYGHFKIITPEGYVYIFGTIPSSRFSSSSTIYTSSNRLVNEVACASCGTICDGPYATYNPPRITIWGLDSIISVTGDILTLTYETYKLIEESLEETDTKCLHDIPLPSLEPSSPQFLSSFYFNNCINTLFENDEMLPKEVKYNDVPLVTFIYNDMRCDIPEGKRLTEILINDYEGNFSKGYKFYNSYTMNAPLIDNCPECDLDNDSETDREYSRSFRLWLNGIEEYSYEGSVRLVNKIYQFEYEDGSLPPRNSKEVDYWGYYNGKSENNSKSTRLPIYYDATFGYFPEGINNSPDIDYAKVGALKKVIYPTGGHREFIYELNDFYEPSRSRQIVQVDKTTIAELSMNATGTERVDFTLTLDESLYELKYRCVNEHNTYQNTYQHIRLYNEDNPGVQINSNDVTRTEDGDVIENLLLEAGDYYIEGFVFPNYTPMVWPYMKVTGYIPSDYEKVLDENICQGGGLRIKRITDQFADNKIQHREFEYTTLNDQNQLITSGVANFPENIIYSNEPFYYQYNHYTGISLVFETSISVLSRSSFAKSELSLSENSPGYVGYSRVIEYEGTKDNNTGCTVYYYETTSSEPIYVNGFYLGHYLKNENDGDLLKKKYYKVTNNPKPDNLYCHNIGIYDQITYTNTPPGNLVVSMNIKEGPVEISGQGLTIENTFLGPPDGYGFCLYEVHVNASSGGIDLNIIGTKHETLIDNLSLTYNGSILAFVDFESSSQGGWVFSDYGQTLLTDFEANTLELIREERYWYDVVYIEDTDYKMFINGIMNGLIQTRNPGNPNWAPYEKHYGNLHYYIVPNNSKFYELTKVEEIDHFESKKIITEKEYSYKPELIIKPTQISTKNSNGQILIEKNKYPPEYVNHILTQRNIISSPIELQNWLDDGTGPTITAGIVNEYVIDEYNHAVLDKTHFLEVEEPTSDLDEGWTTNGYTKIIPTNTSGTVEYVEDTDLTYNNLGQIIQMKKSDDRPISYIWGNHHSFPIAKATNASEDEIMYTSFEDENQSFWIFNTANIVQRTCNTGTGDKIYYGYDSQGVRTNTAVSQRSILSFWGKTSFGTGYDLEIEGDQGFYIVSQNISEPNTEGWKFYEIEFDFNYGSSVITINKPGAGIWLDELRLYPIGTQMTTYTYDPLFGMTSKTDPAGRTTYYEYDSFGRLWKVMNQDENVLKQYQYHYQNQ